MKQFGFGKYIKAARKSLKITGEQLSERCNIDATYLRQIEGGKKIPSLPVFITICNALSVSPNYLLQDDLGANEISTIQELEQLWKNSPIDQQALVSAILKTVMQYNESQNETT